MKTGHLREITASQTWGGKSNADPGFPAAEGELGLLTVEDLTAPTIAVSSCAPQLVNVSVEPAVHTEIVCPVVCCVVVYSWPCPLLSSDALPWTKSLVRDRVELRSMTEGLINPTKPRLRRRWHHDQHEKRLASLPANKIWGTLKTMMHSARRLLYVCSVRHSTSLLEPFPRGGRQREGE